MTDEDDAVIVRELSDNREAKGYYVGDPVVSSQFSSHFHRRSRKLEETFCGGALFYGAEIIPDLTLPECSTCNQLWQAYQEKSSPAKTGDPVVGIYKEDAQVHRRGHNLGSTLCGKITHQGARPPTYDVGIHWCPECQSLWSELQKDAPGKEEVGHDPIVDRRFFINEYIDVAENLDFLLGSVVKYAVRANHKRSTTRLQDLEKCLWYAQRAVDKEKRDATREAGERDGAPGSE